MTNTYGLVERRAGVLVYTGRDVVAESAPTLAIEKGFWGRKIDDPPSFDPALKTCTFSGWAFVEPVGEEEGTMTADYAVAFKPLADLVTAKVAAINLKRDEVLALGAPAGGRRINVDDGARADIGGMGTTALASIVTGGVVPWPESYAMGWIAIDNQRVPLATPADALAFGAAVGDFYGTAVQNARTLKDAALAAAAAETEAQGRSALDAIDIDSGWPE